MAVGRPASVDGTDGGRSSRTSPANPPARKDNTISSASQSSRRVPYRVERTKKLETSDRRRTGEHREGRRVREGEVASGLVGDTDVFRDGNADERADDVL